MKRRIQKVLKDLGFPEAELSLVLTDDARISRLNQTYRRRSGPTNVLAFAQREGEFGQVNPQLLGDVIISVETAAREADLAGQTLEWSLDRLIIHGILHLIGFNHETEGADEKAMAAKSRALMALLGHGANDG